MPRTCRPPRCHRGACKISPARQQIMGVIRAKAEYRTIDRFIRTTGQVAIDETRISSVST